MAYSRVEYTGDGIQTVYTVPFEYLDRSHVHVTIDSIVREYEWTETYRINLSPAPANGAKILIFRDTPKDHLNVIFTSGSTLKSKEINNQALQALFIAQEAFDYANYVIELATQISTQIATEIAQAAISSIVEYAEKALEAATEAERHAIDAAIAATEAKSAAEQAGRVIYDMGWIVAPLSESFDMGMING